MDRNEEVPDLEMDNPLILSVRLEFPNTATIWVDNEKNEEGFVFILLIGYWTMVYNSGIWIRTPSWEFFTTFKLKMHLHPSNIYDCDSLCNLTFPGWYTNRKNGKMGCFQGNKNKLFQNKLNTNRIFSKSDFSNNEEKKNAELEKIKYEDLEFLVKHINSLK